MMYRLKALGKTFLALAVIGCGVCDAIMGAPIAMSYLNEVFEGEKKEAKTTNDEQSD